MKKAWVLTKLYINSLYGISGFLNDLKINKKGAFKKVAIIIFIAFALSGTVGMFVMFNIKMFDYLKELNQQGIIITLTVIIASLLTLVFGMIGIITTYFVDKEGDILLSMPIKAWQILCAKYASNYLYEAVVSLLIMATGFMVYGIKSGCGPLFYLSCIATAAIVPLIPLTIGYFVVIPLMRAGSILRKKDFTMVMTGIIGIVFAMGIQYLSQSMVKVSENPMAMAIKLASKDGLVSMAGKIYYPSVWATYGITQSGSASGFVNFVTFALISLMVVGILIVGMSQVYATSIVGSQEVSKNKKYTEGEIKSKLKSSGVLTALLSRELKLMNREPVYLISGPLVILFMPFIFGFALFMQKGQINVGLESIMKLDNANYYITLGMAGLSVFLGISVNITSTCISREGKTFDLLKGMPIDPKKYLLVKLIHGLIFGVISAVMSGVIGIVMFKAGISSAILALVMAILIMTPVLITGILLELTWPKLLWDNPRKAMKQNMNGVIITIGGMCIVPLIGYLIFKFITKPLYAYGLLIIIPLSISIIMFDFLMKYGSKRFYEIET